MMVLLLIGFRLSVASVVKIYIVNFFFFKQKTAYEMRISDWSSDVCSSDLLPEPGDHVWVRFLDGQPEKPIWEWGMQTITDAKNLNLHHYELAGDRKSVV